MHANRTVVRAGRRPPRAVELLELLALGTLTAPQAAAALGVHPRTARRHLQVLTSSGWASSRTGLVRTYDAAVRPLASIWQHLSRHPLIRAAVPVMAELEREGRLVELAVPSFDEVLALRPTGAGGWHARGLPPHASAAGKLLLAHRDTWRERLLALPLARYTEATIVDPRRLAAELEATRARGFAVERGEHRPGWQAVAAPFAPEPGQVAAITVGCAAFARRDLAELGAHLARASGST
jgi:IclR family transcriptional regulator, acetate operon repressor